MIKKDSFKCLKSYGYTKANKVYPIGVKVKTLENLATVGANLSKEQALKLAIGILKAIEDEKRDNVSLTFYRQTLENVKKKTAGKVTINSSVY